jgi:hypothetical protein
MARLHRLAMIRKALNAITFAKKIYKQKNKAFFDNNILATNTSGKKKETLFFFTTR